MHTITICYRFFISGGLGDAEKSAYARTTGGDDRDETIDCGSTLK